MPANTRFLLEEGLPTLAKSTPEDAAQAFQDYRMQVQEAACYKGGPVSRFDWGEAQQIIAENNRRLGHPDTERRVAVLAGRTAVLWNGLEVPAHRPEGSFLAVDVVGRAVAGMDWRNPLVDEEYGHPDPYLLTKLGGAIAVEKLMRQGADWGEGYACWAKLLGEDNPTIGMATIHAFPYAPERAGEDRLALGYAGTSHRVLSDIFRGVVRNGPEFADVPHPRDTNDYLAGMLDTMSSTVALEALFRRANGSDPKPWIVDMPDPRQPEYAGVNLN